jgi:hypothetical protein
MKFSKALLILGLLLPPKQVAIPEDVPSRIVRNIDLYTAITDYIILKNYHYGYNSDRAFGIGDIPNNDPIILSFMKRQNVTYIRTVGRAVPVYNEKGERLDYDRSGGLGDSLITYSNITVPVFGKHRDLVFNFSTDNKEAFKSKPIKPGIYYSEY